MCGTHSVTKAMVVRTGRTLCLPPRSVPTLCLFFVVSWCIVVCRRIDDNTIYPRFIDFDVMSLADLLLLTSSMCNTYVYPDSRPKNQQICLSL